MLHITPTKNKYPLAVASITSDTTLTYYTLELIPKISSIFP